MVTRVASGRWIALLLLTLLAACSRGPSQEARQCLADLGGMGIQFARSDLSPPGSGCGIDGGVDVRNLSLPFNQKTTMGCQLAMAVNDFENRVVRPAAQRHFGQDVAVVRTYGAYSCRNSSAMRGRLSEHARGRAIDIPGFVLTDGTVVEVKTGWNARDARGAFLREVARGACGIFQLVLTPNSDRDHQDHFHLDLGRYKSCGA